MTRTLARKVRFGRRIIPYRLRRTGRKMTVAIAVDPMGVLVSSPERLAPRRVDELVRWKGTWVMDRLNRLNGFGTVPRREFVSGESYSLLGRQYRLKVIPSNAGVGRVSRVGRRLHVVVPSGLTSGTRARAVRSALRDWYQRRAAEWIPKRASIWAKRVGFPRLAVLIRDQTKRWGSCDTRGRLLINWRIAMAPVSQVDYILAHEVCHLIIRRHGPGFWRFLETIMPDWLDRRTRLALDGRRYTL